MDEKVEIMVTEKDFLSQESVESKSPDQPTASTSSDHITNNEPNCIAEEEISSNSVTDKSSDHKSDFKITHHTDYVVVESNQNSELVEQLNKKDQDELHIVNASDDEPPNKKSKPDMDASSGSISSSAPSTHFKFLPRNVLKGQGQKSGQRLVNSTKVTDSQKSIASYQNADNNQTCDLVDSNSENSKQHFNSSQVSSVQKTVEPHSHSSSSSSSESESEPTHPYVQKSYDANVVLPEDIVRTWRTQSRLKEGEIIEIERESDSLFTAQPVCFSRAVSDFYTKDGKNYLRGCKWSPDGKYLLTNSNDNRLRVYNTPDSCDTVQEEMRSFVKVKEADTVYDFCWYNKMFSGDPETCSFFTTCKNGPIHMWDMNSGCLKCTYRPYNHLDEMTTAHSLAFSLDGRKLYTGYNRMIRVFDVDRPGRDCIQRNTFLKHQGQPGIISCIAASPQGSGIYAAGSYARAIALYHEPDGSMLCMFQGQQGGVTHIGFSPDGTKLYSGGRKDPEILCWDLRKPGQILFVALRLCETNQRLFFDQDSSGRHLFSGCHDGTVCVWDTSKPPVKVLPESDPLLKPVLKFKAHVDCVNGLSMNNEQNMMATCSGQRHYPDIGQSDSDSDDDNAESDCIENTVKLWKFNAR